MTVQLVQLCAGPACHVKWSQAGGRADGLAVNVILVLIL